jgi:hypothetical protein
MKVPHSNIVDRFFPTIKQKPKFAPIYANLKKYTAKKTSLPVTHENHVERKESRDHQRSIRVPQSDVLTKRYQAQL